MKEANSNMAERTRPIRIEFCVTEQERQLIQSKMAQLGTKNMGAYLRKMAIDGVRPDRALNKVV